MPIIEAQAMMTPVITSNIKSFKELPVAAVLADPNDYMNIRKGILHIINDRQFRDELFNDGLENVKRFHPAQIAFLLKIYTLNDNKFIKPQTFQCNANNKIKRS